jgi:hypothetical protein
VLEREKSKVNRLFCGAGCALLLLVELLFKVFVAGLFMLSDVLTVIVDEVNDSVILFPLLFALFSPLRKN